MTAVLISRRLSTDISSGSGSGSPWIFSVSSLQLLDLLLEHAAAVVQPRDPRP